MSGVIESTDRGVIRRQATGASGRRAWRQPVGDFADMFDEIEEGDPCGSGNDSCAYAYDGYCQEGGDCAVATDNYDCYCY